MPQADSLWAIEDSGCHPTVLYLQPKVHFPFFFFLFHEYKVAIEGCFDV